MAGTKQKGRSEDEVVKDFIDTPASGPTPGVMQSGADPADEADEPEYPDHVLEAMLDDAAGTPGAPVPVPSTLASPGTPAMEPMASDVPPTMENIMRMMVHALGQIAAGQANSQVVAAQALDAASRQQQPDNKQAPQISDFNPQGELSYPRPRLKCEMFIPWEAEQESLTWEEIELLNILEAGDYIIKRNDGTKVQVTVKMTVNMDGRPQRVLMNSETQFNDDNHWMMPGLTSILRQIHATKPRTKALAEKVLTMDERVERVAGGLLPVSVGLR